MVTVPSGYAQFLLDIKLKVHRFQGQAALASEVERSQISLYWLIGRAILAEERRACWVSKDINRLARDLKHEFPELNWLRAYNLRDMRRFALEWPDERFVVQVAARVPWIHNRIILDMVPEREVREFYVRQTLENRWPRAELERQIASALHTRVGDLSADAVALAAATHEKISLKRSTRESELLKVICLFLTATRQGFAFVGSDYRIPIPSPESDDMDGSTSTRELRLDLLFYHLVGRCFVVIDLSPGVFQSEVKEQMEYVLRAMDKHLMHGTDAPSVAILVCSPSSDLPLEVHYVLRGTQVALGVSDLELIEAMQRGASCVSTQALLSEGPFLGDEDWVKQ